MKIKVKKEQWTGIGYCINTKVPCMLDCEKCKFNIPKNKCKIERVK